MDFENITPKKKKTHRRNHSSQDFSNKKIFPLKDSMNWDSNMKKNDDQSQSDFSKIDIKLFHPQKDIKQEDINIGSFSDIYVPMNTMTTRRLSRSGSGSCTLNKKITSKGKITTLLFTGTETVVEVNYRKTKLIEFIHYKYLYNCLLQLIFSSVSIISAIVEYEHTVLTSPTRDRFYFHVYCNNYQKLKDEGFDSQLLHNSREASITASYIGFISSILLWITIVLDYILSFLKLNFKVEFDCNDLFQNRMSLIQLIFSFIFFIPCPNPFTYGVELKFKSIKFEQDYFVPLNSFFTTICLLRLWFILKYFLVSNRTYNNSSFRILDMNRVNNGISFPFKAQMIRDPFKIDTLLFCFCLFFCSYNVRIFERYLDQFEEGNNIFGNLLNALWFTYITMITVGYGDLYPSTEFGCIFAILACFFGVFLVSLVVVSVTNYLNIKGSELNVYHVITRSNLMEKKNIKASKLIRNYLMSLQEYHRNEDQGMMKYTKNNNKIVKGYTSFLRARKRIEATFPAISEFEMITENLKYLEDKIIKNDEKIDKVYEMIEILANKHKRNKRELIHIKRLQSNNMAERTLIN